METAVNQEQIIKTYQRLKEEVRHTPILKGTLASQALASPCDLYFKLEQHQLTGSFKIRGVTNKIISASRELLANGIVAASGGNHGRAVAYAGKKFSMPTTVYLPESAPPEKVELIKYWGAETIVAGRDLDEANVIAADIARGKKSLYIHPYTDPEVINGQGTLGIELLNQLPFLETVLVAIGGGGLISGVGTYLKSMKPSVKVIGIEPAGCPTMYNSFINGKITPVTDITTKVGTLAIRCTSELNYKLARECVDEIVLVDDEDMLNASRWLWKEFGIAAEMSGAASFAGLLSGKVKVGPQEKVCCLICGLGKDGL